MSDDSNRRDVVPGDTPVATVGIVAGLRRCVSGRVEAR